MKQPFLIVFFVLVLMGIFAGSVQASLKYYQDPVYQKISEDDHHPMDEIRRVAEEGDVRAQFIMGDLYSKGKGGLKKDLKQARYWFEKAAIHGYEHALVRMAAIAKREKKFLEAWRWYNQAVRAFYYKDKTTREFLIEARANIVKSAKLTDSDLLKAREEMRLWEKNQQKFLRKEKQLAHQKEKEAARLKTKEILNIKEKVVKEKTVQTEEKLEPEKIEQAKIETIGEKENEQN